MTHHLTAAGDGDTIDRDQQHHFTALDWADVLDRIAIMSDIVRSDNAELGERSSGPLARDVHAMSGPGVDEKPLDAQVRQRGARLDALESKLPALQLAVDARHAALEKTIAMTASAAAHS